MKRKNINIPCCVICRTRNHRAGFGITFGSGAHICMECADSIHDLMEQLYDKKMESCGNCDQGEFEF